MVGKGWVQAVALVVIFGFFVMGILAYRTYTASMPQPEKVVTANGEVLFTGADITAGQELFLARGLMEYGSVVGHGAYLGPDYTADYLRRATDFVETQLRRVRHRRTAPGGDLRVPHQPVRRGHRDPDLHRRRRPGPSRPTPSTTAEFFGADSSRNGLVPNVISDPAQVRQLTGVLRLDRVDGGGRPARPDLLVHQQLAARAAGRQQPDRQTRSCGASCRSSCCSAAPASCSRVYGRWSAKARLARRGGSRRSRSASPARWP